MPDGSAYTRSDHAPVAEAPECCAIPEIRQKSSWGGARPGAGRPRKAPVVATYATDDLLWRVFASHPQAEISATRELTRQGYEAYLPMMADRRRDRVTPTMWHEVRVPMLTGYGFIRLTNSQSREPITATRGVRDLLRRPDGRLWWVSDARMDKLREFAEEKLRLPKEHAAPFEAGARVRVTEGPFTDHVGPVVECDGLVTVVRLVMFDRPMPVRVARVAVVEV